VDKTHHERQQWLNAIEEELVVLRQHDTNANWLIAEYKKDMLSLQEKLRTMVVIVDFTKWNQGKEGNVQNFITCLATGWVGPLEKGEEFKANLQYVDFTAECRKRPKKVKVKQTFAYVKTSLLKLHEHGYFEGYDQIIIWSDGGPAHFKVYKTHSWMPEFQKITGKQFEWNNFYPIQSMK